MSAKVMLTALWGLEQGQIFVFDAPTCCILGRARDCGLHVPDDKAHQTVSRHHCLLAINPPSIWVRDLGSRNGTYVNTVNIGQRSRELSPHDGALLPQEVLALEEGDAIQTGNVLLTVHVVEETSANDATFVEEANPPGTETIRRIN